jgi:hypothetical protein
VHYTGRSSTPGYHCAGKTIVNGRGEYCLNVGGCQIDAAVTAAFLAALAPAGLEASLKATEQLEADHETTVEQFRRDVERARYGAQRAERRYRAVDPDNRLVARGLEAEWEGALRELKESEAELARREHTRPLVLTPAERASLLALGKDLNTVWSAPTTTDRDRKELLRTLLEEVVMTVERGNSPHRGRYHRAAASPGRPLSRHGHCRHPQSSRTHHRQRSVVYRQSRQQPAHELGDPVL